MWEKEKLLVTSNFSFSRSVFKRHVLQTHKNQGLFGKGLILYQIIPSFYNLKEKPTGFESIVRKLGNTSNPSLFFLSPQSFLPLKKQKKKSCNLRNV